MQLLHELFAVFGRHQVELIHDDPAGFREQRVTVLAEFTHERVSLLDRILAIKRHRVDDVQEELRALEVPQELVAESGTFSRAFDKARNISDHKAVFLLDTDNAKVRRHRGKGIVRDLRAGVRHRRDEGGLARVRIAEKTDVCEDLQFELERTRLAGFTERELTGSTVRRALEVKVAEAALAASGDQSLFAVFGKVGDHFTGLFVRDDRTDRHAKDDVLASPAVAVGAHAVFA